MFAKESLYINAIKQRSQLKISYKQLKGTQISRSYSDVFVAYDDILNSDTATKINNNKVNFNQNYLSTLLFEDDIKLIKKSENVPEDFVGTNLNSEFNIAVSKDTLFETKNFFDKCKIDYIFSAYHILNLHIEQNPCQNSLVVLLFNNQAFCLIIDNDGVIAFERRVKITPFEDIQDSKFYENELLGQKLYDEIYVLELNEIIKNTLEEFYKLTDEIFIEKISLLYSLKLVSDEHIKKMNDDLMIETTYHPISIDEELFELSKDIHQNKSFIKPQTKPSSSLKSLFITAILILSIAGLAYQFIPKKNNENNKKEEMTKTGEKTVQINLPDHKKVNSFIENRILELFKIIPYDAILDKLTIDKDSSIFDIKLLNKDTFIKAIQPELLKFYENSDIKFKDENNKSFVLNATVTAQKLKNDLVIEEKDYKNIFKSNDTLSTDKVTEKIKMLLPKNSIVTLETDLKNKFVTFNYLVNIEIKTPNDFFEILEKIDNETYPINLNYPIIFKKSDYGIEVDFNLQFHQEI